MSPMYSSLVMWEKKFAASYHLHGVLQQIVQMPRGIWVQVWKLETQKHKDMKCHSNMLLKEFVEMSITVTDH